MSFILIVFFYALLAFYFICTHDPYNFYDFCMI